MARDAMHHAIALIIALVGYGAVMLMIRSESASAILLASLGLLVCLAGCSESATPQTEHVAWYEPGDAIADCPVPLYVDKIRDCFARVDDGRDDLPPGVDAPECVLVLSPYKLSAYDGETGSGPTGFLYPLWAQAPWPSWADRARYQRRYTDDTGETWSIVPRIGVECPVRVRVLSCEGNRAQLGVWW